MKSPQHLSNRSRPEIREKKKAIDRHKPKVGMWKQTERREATGEGAEVGVGGGEEPSMEEGERPGMRKVT